jgi:multiple sugar transport system substrate-binding protein
MQSGFLYWDIRKNYIIRRVFMKKTIFLAALILFLIPAFVFASGKDEGEGAEGGPVTLEFVVWNYSLETIQDNIDKFEVAHPDIKVNLTDYTWPTYHDTLVLRFKGGTQTDIIYNGEDWLPEWAAAGWVAPLEDYFPDVKKYKDKTANYALEDMTYDGKLYGLSYYADLITFQYNKRILRENGLEPPATWDAVLNDSLKLKNGGMNHPFAYEYNATLPNFLQAFMSQVYGRGGDMFDENLNPTFNSPSSEGFKQMQWIQDAKVKHDIMEFSYTHESKVNIGMNTGNHAYTVMYNYMLAAMNNPSAALSGEFDMTLMPGDTHACLGFAKFYCMTQQAAESPRRREAAWTFIEDFGGGDYKVAKRWAVEKGLGFAALPLFDDPDVKDAWKNWIDMEKFKAQAEIAKNGVNTEWTGMWSEFFRPLMAKAMTGDSSVAEVMDQGAKKWNEYKKLLMGN